MAKTYVDEDSFQSTRFASTGSKTNVNMCQRVNGQGDVGSAGRQRYPGLAHGLCFHDQNFEVH